MSTTPRTPGAKSWNFCNTSPSTRTEQKYSLHLEGLTSRPQSFKDWIKRLKSSSTISGSSHTVPSSRYYSSTSILFTTGCNIYYWRSLLIKTVPWENQIQLFDNYIHELIFRLCHRTNNFFLPIEQCRDFISASFCVKLLRSITNPLQSDWGHIKSTFVILIKGQIEMSKIAANIYPEIFCHIILSLLYTHTERKCKLIWKLLIALLLFLFLSVCTQNPNPKTYSHYIQYTDLYNITHPNRRTNTICPSYPGTLKSYFQKFPFNAKMSHCF